MTVPWGCQHRKSSETCVTWGIMLIGYCNGRNSTQSVRSSIYEYIEENGRTYHAYNSGSECEVVVLGFGVDADGSRVYVAE